MPTTCPKPSGPSATIRASSRVAQPAPQPRSSTRSPGRRFISRIVLSVISRWCCSICSPRPASAQRLNSCCRFRSGDGVLSVIVRHGSSYATLPSRCRKLRNPPRHDKNSQNCSTAPNAPRRSAIPSSAATVRPSFAAAAARRSNHRTSWASADRFFSTLPSELVLRLTSRMIVVFLSGSPTAQ